MAVAVAVVGRGRLAQLGVPEAGIPQDHPRNCEMGRRPPESVSRLAKAFPRQRAGRPDLIGAKGFGQAAIAGSNCDSLQHGWGTCFGLHPFGSNT